MSIDSNGVVTNEALARYDAGIKDIIAMRTAEKNPVRYKVVKSTSTGSQTYSFYKKDENDTQFVVDSTSDAITVQDSVDSTSKDPVNGVAVAAEFASQMTTQNINSIIGYTPMDASIKGAANGVASLDGLGQVPVSQLPVVSTYSASGTKPINGTGVAEALATLPEPMVFKGTVGTGGTVTSLPTAATSNKGHTYKAISDNITSGSKVGDTFISTGSEWVVIPSGDEPSGTVTQVGINASSGSHLSASGTVTSSGNLTIGVESGYQIPTSSDVSQITTNKTNILSVKDMVCDDAFSTSKSYAVGDITIYDNKLYKFKNAHQGAWSASDVDQISLSEQNSDLTQGLAELNAHPFLTVPFNHNMVYRGKNLGDTLTDAQHTALSGGNFTDLYLGDYWTKTVTIPAGTYTGGDSTEVTVPAQTNITLKAVIADFDTFYAGYASTYAGINTHHAAVIVTGFSNVVWNGTNSTAGGYVNSLIHKWLVGSVLPQIETWFGSAKVLSHQKLLINAITGDAASGWAWSSQKISLLSENQMYGSKVWGNSKASNGGYEPGEAFKHLNVFNHIDANLLFGNKNIWLRDIASAVGSACLYYGGDAHRNGASDSWVAPAALILLS